MFAQQGSGPVDQHSADLEHQLGRVVAERGLTTLPAWICSVFPNIEVATAATVSQGFIRQSKGRCGEGYGLGRGLWHSTVVK